MLLIPSNVKVTFSPAKFCYTHTLISISSVLFIIDYVIYPHEIVLRLFLVMTSFTRNNNLISTSLFSLQFCGY